jgi:hypothetical protein
MRPRVQAAEFQSAPAFKTENNGAEMGSSRLSSAVYFAHLVAILVAKRVGTVKRAGFWQFPKQWRRFVEPPRQAEAHDNS